MASKKTAMSNAVAAQTTTDIGRPAPGEDESFECGKCKDLKTEFRDRLSDIEQWSNAIQDPQLRDLEHVDLDLQERLIDATAFAIEMAANWLTNEFPPICDACFHATFEQRRRLKAVAR